MGLERVNGRGSLVRRALSPSGLSTRRNEPSYEAWAQRIHPDDREAAEAAVAYARDSGEEYTRGIPFGTFGRIYPLASPAGAASLWSRRPARPHDGRDGRHNRAPRSGRAARLFCLPNCSIEVRNILAVARSVFTRTADDDARFRDCQRHFTGGLDALCTHAGFGHSKPRRFGRSQAIGPRKALSVDPAENPRVTA